MREWKFRAWDGVAKKMYLPHELEQDEVFRDVNKTIYSYLSYGVLCIYDFRDAEPVEFIPMPYTGCYDKDKKEIYEGDLIRFDDRVHQVVWNEEHASFALLSRDGGLLPGGRQWRESAEVIGNIFESPELWDGCLMGW